MSLLSQATTKGMSGSTFNGTCMKHWLMAHPHDKHALFFMFLFYVVYIYVALSLYDKSMHGKRGPARAYA